MQRDRRVLEERAEAYEDEEEDSNDEDDDDLSAASSSAHNSPQSSPRSQRKSPSASPKAASESPMIRKHVSVSQSYQSYSKESPRSWNVSVLISTIIVICSAIAFLLTRNSVADNSTEINHNEELIKNFKNNIADLSYTFKKQDSSIWNNIKASVVDVIKNSDRPSMFILFSNQDDPMICLAYMIANASKAALHSDKILWLTPEAMGDDQGVVLEKYEKEIKKNPVVIIENILGIHPDALQAFHYFCDGEDPLISKAVYIFTMKTTNQRKSKKLLEFIQDQLQSKFRDSIESHLLDPLVTRLSDATIIPIQPEPDMVSCPLRY